MGTHWRVDGHPTEGAQVLDEEREWPNEGRDGCPTEGGVSRGGPKASSRGWPMEEYISGGGPHFWPLSSSAQSHLLEMRVRRVLLNESGIL
jgi:hypothetical protein